jgi:ribosomal protein S18 acetylase RimI-like enzyme
MSDKKSATDDREKQVLCSASHLNLAGMFKHRALFLPQGQSIERNGLLCFSIGCPSIHGYLNGALLTSNELPGREVVRLSRDFFQALGYGFVTWIRDQVDDDLEQLLKSEGMTPVEDPGGPVMYTPNRLDLSHVPDGIEIRLATNAQDANDFASVTAEAFQMTSAIGKLAAAQIGVSKDSKVRAFVARENGKPISAAMAFVDQGIAGLYYVGTIPTARGRGLGSLCTLTATNAGFDLGARAVILQASQQGQTFYERIGYEVLTRYRWYSIDCASSG